MAAVTILSCFSLNFTNCVKFIILFFCYAINKIYHTSNMAHLNGQVLKVFHINSIKPLICLISPHVVLLLLDFISGVMASAHLMACFQSRVLCLNPSQGKIVFLMSTLTLGPPYPKGYLPSLSGETEGSLCIVLATLLYFNVT